MTTAMLRPIETVYRGYRFRSRLEARWAVFFDALGVRWEYEPEGFVTLSGPYLPDFALPDWGAFAECKPDVAPEHRDLEGYIRAQTFAGFNKRGPVIGLIGTPDMIAYRIWVAVEDWGSEPPDPRGVRLQWIDLASSAASGSLKLYANPSDVARLDAMAYSRMEYAVQAARGARFEHGQSPNVKAWQPPRPKPAIPKRWGVPRTPEAEALMKRLDELDLALSSATTDTERDAIVRERVAVAYALRQQVRR